MLDLFQTLCSFVQSFLQPLELSSRVCHVSCDFIRTVVEDSVQAEHPQTRLYQLGVKTTCGKKDKAQNKAQRLLDARKDHYLNMLQIYLGRIEMLDQHTKCYIPNTERAHISMLKAN